MKKRSLFLVLIAFLILIPFSSTKAAETRSGKDIYISPSEIVTGNLYAAGENIIIDGTVTGDIIGAAQNIKINGELGGDLIGAAQTIDVNGKINGNARIIGEFININGSVLKNINVLGANISLGEKSLVGWDLLVAGENLSLKGIIEGRLDAHAQKVLISGQIKKDANIRLDGEKQKLTLLPETIIGGNLNYTSLEPAEINKTESILGHINQKITEPKKDHELPSLALAYLLDVLAALAVGIIFVFTFKKTTKKIISNLDTFSWKNSLIALLLIVITPLLTLIAAITIIGLPLALISGSIYLIVLYLAKIITAFFIGKLIFDKIKSKNKKSNFWPLVLGIIICWLIFAVPYVGCLAALMAIIFALGGFITYVKDQSGNL